MKSLVFAEKPSVAKEMARVLKCENKQKGYFEGKDYIVTWALGHLATLYEPGDYNQTYKSWSIDVLPIIPEKMKIKKLKKTTHQYKTVEYLMKRKDVKDLIIATDAGREGELVARWTMKLAKFNKPFKRLWISSQTDKAIKDGFTKLKPGKDYDRLYYSAVCRAEADWIIGLNLSRVLTCHYNTQLSSGRVQTPTLAMIVEREKEIKSFKPKPFWEIKIDFDGYYGHWRSNKNNSGRIFDEEYVNKLKAKFQEKKGIVTNIELKNKTEEHPLAYDLTELQRDANRKFGFSAKKTLSLIQTLYERHKVLTYPRTDSKYITTDMVGTLKERLIALKGSSYEKFADKILKNGIKTTKRFVDNSKVSDHHAIIPTEQKPNFKEFSNDERKIYNLAVKRFLAVLLPAYKYNEIRITTEVAGEKFHSKGKEVILPGWKEIATNISNEDISDEEMLPEQNLKAVKKGEEKNIISIKDIKGHTKAPSLYTESALLGQMEKWNLGTPATRAEIIEKIISSFYVERNGNKLSSTSKGKQLIDLVPAMMKSPELTAEWEKWLEKISKGKAGSGKFMAEIKQKATELIEEVKQSEVKFKLDNLSSEKCPMCGKSMLQVKGKKGRKMLVCQDRECGYRENVQRNGETGMIISKRDRIMNKKMINKYADNKEEIGTNLGDLLKNFMK